MTRWIVTTVSVLAAGLGGTHHSLMTWIWLRPKVSQPSPGPLPSEKQALLEAPDLKTRAEILVAVTEIELAKANTEGETPLQ